MTILSVGEETSFRAAEIILWRDAAPVSPCEDEIYDMSRGRIPPSQCDHSSGPLLIERANGSRRARCLKCGTVGPERPTAEEAREALEERGRGYESS